MNKLNTKENLELLKRQALDNYDLRNVLNTANNFFGTIVGKKFGNEESALRCYAFAAKSVTNSESISDLKALGCDNLRFVLNCRPSHKFKKQPTKIVDK